MDEIVGWTFWIVRKSDKRELTFFITYFGIASLASVSDSGVCFLRPAQSVDLMVMLQNVSDTYIEIARTLNFIKPTSQQKCCTEASTCQLQTCNYFLFFFQNICIYDM
jgi:hypothetical protein